MQNRKKKLIKYCCLVVALIALCVLVYKDSFLYSTPIIKVSSQETLSSKNVTDLYGKSEKSYVQKVSAVYQNTINKDNMITFENIYSQSEVLNQKYKKGDFLFISTLQDGSIQVTGYKRDYAVCIAFVVMSLILIAFGKKKEKLTLLGLIINIIVTAIVMLFYEKGINLVFLSVVASLIFIVITILFVNGKNTNSYVSILSTVLAITASSVLTFIVVTVCGSKGINFEQMNLVIKHVKELFYIQLILGNLGGVMDVAVSISSSASEIYKLNPDMDRKALKKSVYTLGTDIMGTMTSTIMFAYISGSIPLMVLFIKNGYSISYIYSNCLNIEIIRALTGCIAMIISVPVTSYFTLNALRKKDTKE